MAFQNSRRPNPMLLPGAVVAIVAILLIAGYFLYQGPGPQQISSNKTITMPINSSFNFYLPSNKTAASLYLVSSSNSSALLYLSRTPVLEKNVMIIPLIKGGIVNISIYGSPYADMQISMVSGSYKSAVISLFDIPKNLDIRPATLQFLNASSSGSGLPSTTTTVSGVSTAPTTTAGLTSSASTTTVPAKNPTQQALIYSNESVEGTLIVNYNHLYSLAASKCTPSAYNNTYVLKHSTLPTGPNTYANATQVVPTSIFAQVKQISPTLYNITYVAEIKNASIGNLDALQLQINTTTQFVRTYTFEGIFEGLTYSSALQQYQALNASTNPCSPYVP